MPDAELDELRVAIDDVDSRLLSLLAERVHLVLKVGAWKRRHGRAVYDPERERRVLTRLTERLPPPLDGETVRRIFERVIDESRRIEQRDLARD